MAAGQGFIEFSTGDILTAAAANGYLASQVVMVFASAAARTSAIASPQEGMISYLKDTNSTEYYSGSAWVAIGGASGGLTLISNTALSGTSVTIGSIPQTYKYLKFFINGAYLGSGSANGMSLRFNSDTGNNYSDGRLSVNASSFNGEAAINQSSCSLGYSLGVSSGGQQKYFGNWEVQNYTDTSGGIGVRGGSSSYVNSTHSSSFNNNTYNNSAAITSMTFIAIGGASFGGGNVLLYGVN